MHILRNTLLGLATAATLTCAYETEIGAGAINPINVYDAGADTLTHVQDFENARRYLAKFGNKTIDGTYGEVELNVVHLYGDAYQRGYAHGVALAEEVLELHESGVPMYLSNLINQLHKYTDPLPPALQTLLNNLIAYVESKEVWILNTILQRIYTLQQPYIEKMPMKIMDEMRGIGDGACHALPTHPYCLPNQPLTMQQRVTLINFLPEMIKMTCTIAGAKGNATPEGTGLVQLRALDFGGGPFANRSALFVHHLENDTGNDFVSLSFPSAAFAITGWSTKVALSEKVWLTEHGVQPGTYRGEAVVMVMREMLQESNSVAHAIEIAKNANRTWAVWLGVGDYSNDFNMLAYRQKTLVAYDDQTLPSLTSQPIIPNVTYVDKFPQPSKSVSLPNVLQELHGKLDGYTMASRVPHTHGTGDVHIAVYDFEAQQSYISIGLTDADGNYQKGMKAHERPYIRFNFQDLWDIQLPKKN